MSRPVQITRRHLLASGSALGLAAALAACSGSTTPAASQAPTAVDAATEATSAAPATGPVTIENNLGSTTVTLPVTKVASLDNRTFEVLAAWGVPLVAAPLSLMPSTITAYTEATTVNIGNHREPNLELLTAAEPDLIISGQRFTQHNEAIAALTDAPLIDLEPREGQPLDTELARQVTTLGTIFGKTTEAEALVKDLEDAVARVKAAYDPAQKVLAVNVSGGEIGYVAPSKGRTWGPLYDLLGLTPALTIEGGTTSHTGDDVSVETIAASNPDWILVLDRDGAISSKKDSYTPAQEVISGNAALANVTALTQGHVVYAPTDTYTNESIITYTEILTSMAEAFEAAKK